MRLPAHTARERESGIAAGAFTWSWSALMRTATTMRTASLISIRVERRRLRLHFPRRPLEYTDSGSFPPTGTRRWQAQSDSSTGCWSDFPSNRPRWNLSPMARVSAPRTPRRDLPELRDDACQSGKFPRRSASKVAATAAQVPHRAPGDRDHHLAGPRRNTRQGLHSGRRRRSDSTFRSNVSSSLTKHIS